MRFQKSIRKYYKGLRLLLALLKSILLRKRIPTVCSLHVTNFCNLRCRYCYANVDDRFEKNNKEFTTAEIKEYIDELYALGTRWFIILGGEPLLRKDIKEIIEHLDKKNVLIELVTNGFFAKHHLETIKLVDFVCISLDGDEKSNDEIRGKGSYIKALEAVQLLTKNNITVRIHCTLTNAVLDSIDHLEDIAKKYCVQYGYSQPILHEYNKKETSIYPDEKTTNSFWKKLKEKKASGSPCYNSSFVLDYVTQWPLGPYERVCAKEGLKPLGGFRFIPCRLGRRYVYIDSSGIMYPCIVTGVTKGIDIREHGIKEAWKKIAAIPCYACSYIQYVENNVLLNLHPSSILKGLTYLSGGLNKKQKR